MNFLQSNGIVTEMITFKELSKQGTPMGYALGKAVFENSRFVSKAELGKTYICHLSEKTGSNCWFADIITEVTAEDIYNEHKDDLFDWVFKNHRELLRAEINEMQKQEVRSELENRYALRMAELEEKIRVLESQVENPIQSQTPENPVNGLNGTVLTADFLEDGYYSIRYNINRNMILLFKDEDGPLHCVNGKVNMGSSIEVLGDRKIVLKECMEFNGVLIEAHAC